MFYIKCITIHKVEMHTGVIRKLLHVVCVCTGDNHSLKLVGYFLVQYFYAFIYLFILFLACILDEHIVSYPSVFDFIGYVRA